MKIRSTSADDADADRSNRGVDPGAVAEMAWRYSDLLLPVKIVVKGRHPIRYPLYKPETGRFPGVKASGTVQRLSRLTAGFDVETTLEDQQPAPGPERGAFKMLPAALLHIKRSIRHIAIHLARHHICYRHTGTTGPATPL